LVPPDQADGPLPLLITGLPGSGKSHFGRALGALGWTFLEGDNAGAWPDAVHEAWDLALAGDDDALRLPLSRAVLGIGSPRVRR
jgi:hypothetical protein